MLYIIEEIWKEYLIFYVKFVGVGCIYRQLYISESNLVVYRVNYDRDYRQLILGYKGDGVYFGDREIFLYFYISDYCFSCDFIVW